LEASAQIVQVSWFRELYCGTEDKFSSVRTFNAFKARDLISHNFYSDKDKILLAAYFQNHSHARSADRSVCVFSVSFSGQVKWLLYYHL